MGSMDEHILKAAKEIVVKFIECGRLSPTGFAETFQAVYKTVNDTVRAAAPPPPDRPPEPPRKGK
ncbi:MAG TPA: conjugal transfer protein TraB [Desulfobacterales bacterium]|nr:conjugal transfer protein TraB [Desulfobacterales bacterium]